jgi:hypothetical protein
MLVKTAVDFVKIIIGNLQDATRLVESGRFDVGCTQSPAVEVIRTVECWILDDMNYICQVERAKTITDSLKISNSLTSRTT